MAIDHGESAMPRGRFNDQHDHAPREVKEILATSNCTHSVDMSALLQPLVFQKKEYFTSCRPPGLIICHHEQSEDALLLA